RLGLLGLAHGAPGPPFGAGLVAGEDGQVMGLRAHRSLPFAPRVGLSSAVGKRACLFLLPLWEKVGPKGSDEGALRRLTRGSASNVPPPLIRPRSALPPSPTRGEGLRPRRVGRSRRAD